MANATQWDRVIVGLGESGHAAACHLAAAGERVAVLDTRLRPPRADDLRARFPEVPVITGDFDDRLLANAAEIVLSPGVDPRHPALAAARQRGQPIIGEIELFARAVSAPVIGITGSNGKTTVTRMVAAMAAQAGVDVVAGGNLGPAALTLLEQHPDAECFVLELSSFQLETTRSLRPRVAAVLNISPDHLDRYENMADYAAAKARVFTGSGHAVINADDPWVRTMATSGAGVSRFAGESDTEADWRPEYRSGVEWLTGDGEAVLSRDEMQLPGRHNTLNALASLAIGDAFGLDRAAMREALRAFRPLPHRTESLGWHGGRLWINDSKATNVASAVAAVSGMDVPVVLLAGGEAKGQRFEALAAALDSVGRAAVVYGRDAAAIADALGDTLTVEVVDDLDAAVIAAQRLSRRGDAVLLSPACASLDQFRDYRARGEHFRRRVEAMGNG
ncbi:UDP-N-acetylmuramoyl-L-alanine--D-glutamate ligase [Spiribacter vilamensis]|uniref:UDP-N-acetylmuramoylalanine--D-glutamate ligase n=1 Tax=Spiribacter vilamensis TaxID=531306 RepID=A0A4Q8CY74_9GAMM|nr:UDP-N-acetylmuramoyl-L-alanine--D-glutamate ligase [Spiribacter vilamensis]RZU97911.1 UDP-N-acetylmuramoylalanine--D-glutamate ligase [Spiribacter vilamensis]TVO61175.1 UDP-N-acetylmuramoyl-L-alanine--D-glutamate ligase [Spiribacter vilamensis]